MKDQSNSPDGHCGEEVAEGSSEAAASQDAPGADAQAHDQAHDGDDALEEPQGAEATRDSKKPRRPIIGASLSSPLRARGWEKPRGELAKYRSLRRSSLRFILQRVGFRAVVHSAITPHVQVPRRVKGVRGPYVLVANHTSHVDGPLLAMSLPWSQARFLSTGAAADYWFTKWHRRVFVRWMLNAFPVDRGASRKHSGLSRRLLRSGVPILVFPEGGRQKDGRMKDFNPGGAALAIGVGVPVIPAAIIGGYEAMPKGRSWPVPGRPSVGVVFGDPMIADEGESAVEFSTRIREQVKSLYDNHHDEILGSDGSGQEEGTS